MRLRESMAARGVGVRTVMGTVRQRRAYWVLSERPTPRLLMVQRAKERWQNRQRRHNNWDSWLYYRDSTSNEGEHDNFFIIQQFIGPYSVLSEKIHFSYNLSWHLWWRYPLSWRSLCADSASALTPRVLTAEQHQLPEPVKTTERETSTLQKRRNGAAAVSTFSFCCFCTNLVYHCNTNVGLKKKFRCSLLIRFSFKRILIS